ncbi:MAG: NAAT family transporter [Bacteroidetes bacterium]|nr:NAAT family transporter [Bacteroidota bacterium]
MEQKLAFFLVFFTGLISVLNPLSAVPVWLSLTGTRSDADKRVLMRKIARNIFITLLVILLLGNYILNFFGITLPAIRIAGAILVLNSGLGMVINREKVSAKALTDDKSREDISFSPMTMPFLVGPGTMALVLSYADQVGPFWESWQHLAAHSLLILGIALAALVAYLAIRSSEYLQRYLGSTGIVAMTKIMGFIVLSVGVQMLLNTVDLLAKQYPQWLG